jgi:hypothetical protein
MTYQGQVGISAEINSLTFVIGTQCGEEECVEDPGGNARKKRPLERFRCRWEDNIKINLRDIERGVMNSDDLILDKDHRGLL